MRIKIVWSDGSVTAKNTADVSHLPATMDERRIDLHAIGNAIFFAEDAVHSGLNVSRTEVPCYQSYGDALADRVETLQEFLFGRYIRFVPVDNPQARLSDEVSGKHRNAVTCLFSNGLDSYSGILNANTEFRHVVGALTNHCDQKNLLPLLNKMRRGPLGKCKIEVKVIEGPKHGSYTRVSRGVLYALNSLLLGNDRLIISEIGPTMYQPRFTLLDSISLTTHPKVLQLVKEIAEEVLGTEIQIMKPNEDLTKAEVAAVCPLKEYIPITCSCITTRWANSRHPNCGACYSCVVRRLALLAAGIEDSKCKNDLKGSTAVSALEQDNLAQLLRFSIDVLTNIDDMPWYETETMRKYGKRDVFERFALDNLAGLMMLSKERSRNAVLQKFVRLSTKVATKERLEERMSAIKDCKFKPNFENFV